MQKRSCLSIGMLGIRNFHDEVNSGTWLKPGAKGCENGGHGDPERRGFRPTGRRAAIDPTISLKIQLLCDPIPLDSFAQSRTRDSEELSCFHLIPFGPLHGKNRKFPFQPR